MTKFPFSAVVGQDDAKLALVLNAIDPRIGGVLLRGQKGSAKSTLVRGIAALIPGAPFVELPVGATEDRVVGTIDIEAALGQGARRFHPGLLADAHEGVLYVDEVNLLPDHLVDVLLDVAASGVNRVEREGMSESHPSRFVLAGSMNPEEGELRPQLLDRFGLAVDVIATTVPRERAEAVRRRLEFDADPEAFERAWMPEESTLAKRLETALPGAVSPALVERVTALCASVGAEGLRADIVICRAAAALAGWEGREDATVEDVRRVAPLALAHRRRRDPFDEPGIDHDDIDAGLEPEGVADELNGDRSERDSGTQDRDPAPAGTPRQVVTLRAARSVVNDVTSGRRSTVEAPRGRVVGDRMLDGPLDTVAVGATVRAAAARVASSPVPERSEPLVQSADLRAAVREQRAGNLLVLAVDASASMGVERRMEAVKGAVVGLLLDAYQRRDRVAVVTFRGDGAEVVLRPTGSVEVARARLASVPTGGRTPLAAGIDTALQVAGSAPSTHRPLIVVVSDGRATAGPPGADPVDAAVESARRVRRRGIDAVVIDAEEGAARLDLARTIAEAMGARCLTLSELSVEALTATVQGAVRTLPTEVRA